jgi:hypothetical protein
LCPHLPDLVQVLQSRLLIHYAQDWPNFPTALQAMMQREQKSYQSRLNGQLMTLRVN